MDGAVALVQAYLYANGYFTVTEYPVVWRAKEGGYRAATDLDVLAVRFPGAGRILPSEDGGGGVVRIFDPDPALRTSDDHVDLVIAEVKEGEAMLNRGARDPGVLRAALARFGAAPPDEVDGIVERLVTSGNVISPSGARVRLLAFGATRPTSKRRYHAITLGHVVNFIRGLVRDHWEMMQQARFKDPAMEMVMVLEKARRASADARPRGVHRRRRGPRRPSPR